MHKVVDGQMILVCQTCQSDQFRDAPDEGRIYCKGCGNWYGRPLFIHEQLAWAIEHHVLPQGYVTGLTMEDE